MLNGYVLVLDTDIQCGIIPNDSGLLDAEIDGIHIAVSNEELTISGQVSRVRSISYQQITGPADDDMAKDAVTEQDDKGRNRTCISCKGKVYCVTNACANTPCGWICSPNFPR